MRIVTRKGHVLSVRLMMLAIAFALFSFPITSIVLFTIGVLVSWKTSRMIERK